MQSLYYEILAGVWVRNGLQIKGQAMTYIQANFCNSMVDMDLYFLQLCATNLKAQVFLETAIKVFNMSEWLGAASLEATAETVYDGVEQDQMLEGLLTFLATLVTSKTNMGNDDAVQCRIEISALLATGDRTHSQLLELMPERSGNVHTRNFETFLKSLSTYRSPPVGSENLEQGLFMPLPQVWEEYYDPLHVLLRAVHRRDYQNSMDRFGEYVKGQKKMPKSGNLWPPFRVPDVWEETNKNAAYTNPCCVLNSKVMHAALLSIFYRALYSHNVSENLLSLAVFLLEIAVTTNAEAGQRNMLEDYPSDGDRENDEQAPKLLRCYPTDCLAENLRAVVGRVSLRSGEPQNYAANYNAGPGEFDSDSEWDVFERPMLTSGMEVERLPAVSHASSSTTSSSRELALTSASVNLSGVVEPMALQPQFDDDVDDDEVDEDEGDILMIEQGPAPDRPDPLDTAMVASINSIVEVALRRRLIEEPLATATADNMVVPFVPPGTDDTLDVMPASTSAATASPSQSTAVAAAGPSSSRTTVVSRIRPFKELIMDTMTLTRESPNDETTFSIDESIISLLLKLHSHLSGTLDSFSLDDDDNDEVEQQPEEEEKAQRTNQSRTLSKGAGEAAADSNMDVVMGSCENVAASTSQQQLNDQQKLFCDTNKRPRRPESRIGDGPYFIGNVLRKIARMDSQCAQNIREIRQRLWPNQRERQAEQQSREIKEKEERSKRAKERQMKLMAEFASKQKLFMEGAAASSERMAGLGGRSGAGGNNSGSGITVHDDVDDYDEDDEDAEMEVAAQEKEYVCIICNRTSASTEDDPIGLVVLVESSSVIGHRRQASQRYTLPLCDEEKAVNGAPAPEPMSRVFNERIELLSARYGEQSWYFGQNVGWEGGVHVQSCGHHVHLICHDAYILSLFSAQRPQNLNVERGEFLCPVCRQLSNCVLPLNPQLDMTGGYGAGTSGNSNSSSNRMGVVEYPNLVAELQQHFGQLHAPVSPNKLSDAMRRAMNVMTDSIPQQQNRVLPNIQHTLLLPMSIARTNLEAEIIQRGGSLCVNNEMRYKPKRECIGKDKKR